MALLQRQTAIRRNELLYELQTHGSADFPFQAYLNDFSRFRNQFANWHCHSELEFTVVVEGKFDCGINDKHYELSPGDGVFINTNVLHMTKPLTDLNHSVTFSLVFSPDFIAENPKSLIYQKFVEPILSNGYFKGCMLSSTIEWQKELIQCLQTAYEIASSEEEALELSLRNCICMAWQTFTKSQLRLLEIEAKPVCSMVYEQRAKETLSYIQEHYREAIGINDMIRAGNISRTDCFRSFKKIIGKSPMEYLNDYRLKQAMYLLETTQESITEIATSCGFNHLSYFGKLFRETTGLSPKEYRAQRMKY